MEDKIEVGEYVRTKDGLIGKIKKFIPHYTKGKREGQEVEENFLLMGQEQCEFIESIDYRIPPCYPSDEEWEKIKKYIVKLQKENEELKEEIKKYEKYHKEDKRIIHILQRENKDLEERIREHILLMSSHSIEEFYFSSKNKRQDKKQ